MIKSAVQSLIKKFKTNDPFELAEQLKINVCEWNLHHEIRGFYKYDRRNRYIFINSNLNQYEKRATCCHELGHAQLHTHANTPFMREKTLLSVEKIEVEANTFAIELLLPDSLLEQYKNTSYTLTDVALIHNVPKEWLPYKKTKIF
ncbi:ImmA/IrrE family metallo-endopeptidase [Bacillus altitudinis]|uniref:ImmA/IrrE family metallo-endopeptidase n=1 Tax=Bacillus TaxID=1386 RepID=UPI0011E9497E|nr:MULTISPECIES: ImmA/IrrE family metallo-endopeptidase [Bacillus]TYS28388.1 ImmA/IrrE family metallo-endopeptidase [Bacillus altitudinis]TYS36592.1 ImmA/IrrE family metallo-endopeptidase [Bacillus pumilus]TYS53398.1 ImmA/IrrE family metallo-endopeptidase [Bacillus pumilus]